LNIIHVGHGRFRDCQAFFRRIFFHRRDLQLRIQFTGSIQRTHCLGVRNQFQRQVDLPAGGIVVGCSGDISTRFFHGLHQFGRLVVHNRGSHDRDRFGRIGDDLRSGCGNRMDQVHLVVHEPLADGLQIGLIPLGVLLVDFNVYAFLEAFGGKSVHKPLVGGVESAMLHQLEHADLVNLCCRFRRLFLFAAAASQGPHRHHRADCESHHFFPIHFFQHLFSHPSHHPFFTSRPSILREIQNRPLNKGRRTKHRGTTQII